MNFGQVTIAANQTWNQTATGQLNTSVPAGTYKAVLMGNTGGTGFDFTTTGSGVNPVSFTATAIPSSLPDLVVSALTAPATGTIGGQIAMTSTVLNQSTTTAGTSRLGFYFSTDSNITTSDVFSGSSCNTPTLVSNSSSNCNGLVNVPSSLAPGGYYFGAIANDLGAVSEVNNTNNARAVSITLIVPPDTTPPTVPSGPSAAAASSSQINLSWGASTDSGGSGLAGYALERCAGAGCTSFALLLNTPSTSYNNTGLSASTAYSYRLRAYDAAGNYSGYSSVVSATTLPTAGASPVLSNISTRGPVLTGDNVMIGGFIISGSTPKTVLIRARGPSMAAYGVPGLLADPVVDLYSGTTVIASNNDWNGATNAAQIQATGLAPTNALESAILTTLSPGAYTAIVRGLGGSNGVGIVEVMAIDNPASPLINFSTRGQVQTGDNVMIGGFIISGSTPKTVLIRARGPSMAAYGVPGLLADPVVDLYSGSTVIASNDDWNDATNAAQIQATGLAPTDALESAILITLNPGAYTAIVHGFNGSTGVGIVEVLAQ
jgi:hypothetical protein